MPASGPRRKRMVPLAAWRAGSLGQARSQTWGQLVGQKTSRWLHEVARYCGEVAKSAGRMFVFVGQDRRYRIGWWVMVVSEWGSAFTCRPWVVQAFGRGAQQ